MLATANKGSIFNSFLCNIVCITDDMKYFQLPAPPNFRNIHTLGITDNERLIKSIVHPSLYSSNNGEILQSVFIKRVTGIEIRSWFFTLKKKKQTQKQTNLKIKGSEKKKKKIKERKNLKLFLQIFLFIQKHPAPQLRAYFSLLVNKQW